MKYTCSIIINQPLNKVIDLFDSTDNLKHWMEGLESFEHISGIPGNAEAKSKLVFNMGKRKIEMVETIIAKNLPDQFDATYEARDVFNIVKSKFIAVDENKTNYITEQEFHFKGIMKFFGLLMPGAFKKQSMKYLTAFKNFAESR